MKVVNSNSACTPVFCYFHYNSKSRFKCYKLCFDFFVGDYHDMADKNIPQGLSGSGSNEQILPHDSSSSQLKISPLVQILLWTLLTSALLI